MKLLRRKKIEPTGAKGKGAVLRLSAGATPRMAPPAIKPLHASFRVVKPTGSPILARRDSVIDVMWDGANCSLSQRDMLTGHVYFTRDANLHVICSALRIEVRRGAVVPCDVSSMLALGFTPDDDPWLPAYLDTVALTMDRSQELMAEVVHRMIQ